MEKQQVDLAAYKPTPWYHHHNFAVLPHFWRRKADRYNTASFKFHWLVFRAWTMDSPDIGFEVTYSIDMLQIRARFPYLITGLFIPLAPTRWVMKHFWRHAPRSLGDAP